MFAPVVNPEGTKILYSSNDDMYEMNIDGTGKQKLAGMEKAFTPFYSKEGNKIVFARNDGIYIKDTISGRISAVIKSKNHSELYSRPSMTSDGQIIYFKAVISPDMISNTGRIKTEAVIYKMDSTGKNKIKIVQGSNPSLSKDGRNLAFEADGKIFVMNLDTKEQKLIDEGKLPSWSPSGKYLSYIKAAEEVTRYDKIPEKTNLYLEKQYLSIWIANLDNLDLKYKLTEEEYVQSEAEIDKWAKETTDTSVDQHFVLSNKYSYYDSSWGTEDKDFYSVRSSEKEGFELMKFELDYK